MDKNYTIFHIHSDFSILDSATKFELYINKAKELGMKSICISEHGNFYNWTKKKQYCDKVGIKYIHGCEFYVTESIENKVRDNWHVILMAKNWDGVKELNKMSSIAYQKDGHFYYDPRITIDELIHTSNNIIVSTSCLGGILNSDNENVKRIFIDFIIENKDRCFLEIQHHNDKNGEQSKYNQYLFDLSNRYSLNLWAGTDTHSFNDDMAELRKILQRSKNINYANESDWDLTFKTYDQLVESYKAQNSLSKSIYLEAIENTNRLNDMVEDFKFDYTYKYPKVYDNAEEVFREKVYSGLSKKGLKNNKEYVDRIEYEIAAIAKNGAIDYLLLQEKITSWCKDNGIFPGPSRGSVSGSICAYLLGITEIDSIKFGMNFERFMNSERVSLSDIDIDYPPDRREDVKNYIFNDLGLQCCDIVAFNTVATKGAIRDVARALGVPLEEVNEICNNIENNKEKYEKKYPEIFKYSNQLEGVITSAGIHPCGTVVADANIQEELGLFTTSTDTHPISQIDMKGVDSLNFVKLDILGLDNIQIINETCALAGIKRLNPDNVNFKDINIWEDIKNNNLGVFQWESDFARQVYNRLFSKETLSKISDVIGEVDYLSLLSIGNGILRPAGESYRDDVCDGIFKDNGHPALNELLKSTMGYLVYQEQIIEFLNKFCGYSMGQADLVRRSFAKKSGDMDIHIPKIKAGFIKAMKEKYNLENDESEKIIVSFLKVIEDASAYLFSLNHSQPYSMIGYMCAYLRYYHKLEFLTSMLNINSGNIEKSSSIIEYAKTSKINIQPPKFRKSKSSYLFDRNENSIYKGISSIKFLSKDVGDMLYEIGKLEFNNFVDFLIYAEENGINSSKLLSLIKINYFEEFGNNKKLELFYEEFTKGVNRYSKKLSENSKIKRKQALYEFFNNLKNERYEIYDQIKFENEILGYVQATYPVDKKYLYVTSVDVKFSPRVDLYCLNTGKTDSIKIQKNTFANNKINSGDIIYAKKFTKKPSVKFVNGNYVQDDNNYQWWLDSYQIISPKEFDTIIS